MKYELSYSNIESYVGDVIALSLVGGEELVHADIKWGVTDGEIAKLRNFFGDDLQSFNNGVLITLKKEGITTVFAELDGERYECNVTARPMKNAKKGETLQYFFGDFHAHTSKEHNHAKFAALEENPVDTYLDIIKNDEKLDCTVISDHASTTNDREFFRGIDGAARLPKSAPVVFAGSEAEVTVREEDRFGITYKNSGEVVFINTDQYLNPHEWQSFYDALDESPFGVCILAHPYIVGHSTKGIWNFSLHKNDPPVLRDRLRGIEMGNGIDRQSNQINEYMYSLALDNGFRVSTTCGSDHHGTSWGFDVCPGKTILMAYDGSKEALLDALFERSFYASESGNVKIYYTVNGVEAAGDIPDTDEYSFHIEFSTFFDDPAAIPVTCQVISDRGECIKEIEGDALETLDFIIHSDSARYFYLRLVDGRGRRTWSAPVWTGRKFEKSHATELPPVLDKTDFSVTELESGKDASVLVNGDPMEVFSSSLTSASYVIDMKKAQTVSALGHYSPFMDRKKLVEDIKIENVLARLTSRYEIAVSLDGEDFTTVKTGQIRVFSGEEVLCFEPCPARYVRFTVISTVGGAGTLEKYRDEKVWIAELSLFGV